MKSNVASVPAASRRSSPSVWPWARSAVVALLLASCGGVALAGGGIAFRDVLTAVSSRHDTGPTLVVARTDASYAILSRLVPKASRPADGRVLVAAFQGQRPTAGHAIRILRIERAGDVLRVHAIFATPAQGAAVAQVVTSPVHVVSVAAADLAGARTAVLLDEAGAERGRVVIG
jgi:hypothetical protein